VLFALFGPGGTLFHLLPSTVLDALDFGIVVGGSAITDLHERIELYRVETYLADIWDMRIRAERDLSQ